jgi:recombinational DNA repair protein RecT
MTNVQKTENPIEILQPTEKSILNMVTFYKENMLKRASDDIRKSSPEKQEAFFLRTITSIIKNDGLKECFNSAQGKISIYTLIDDCLKTGLQLDLHAYAIPYGKKVKQGNNDVWIKEAHVEIKRQGYVALLCGGDRPIFKNILWGVVYEKEKNNVSINRATGEVNHPISIEADRGKPIGCWVQAEHLDGHKEAEFYPVSFIYNIRNNHSKTYQDYLAKKISTCTWLTDEIPMIEKTAIKAFTKPYADVKEELANAFYSENYEPVPENNKSTEDIACEICDNAADNLKEAQRNVKEETEIDEPEPKEKEKSNSSNESLF